MSKLPFVVIAVGVVLLFLAFNKYLQNSFHYHFDKQYEDLHTRVSVHLSESKVKEENILDGCYHIYLDVGSNVGIQIRKLFEPELYPDAPVHEIFNSEFGTLEERKLSEKEGRFLCAVGFEPNFNHEKALKDIEMTYNKCGWKVKMLTRTAVSDHAGNAAFYSDHDFSNKEWGGGILPPKMQMLAYEVDNPNFENVKLIKFSDFLNNVVGKRVFPTPVTAKYPPKVLVKMDVEGSELDVFADVLFTGGLKHITSVMVEWHPHLEKLENRKISHRLLQETLKLLSQYSKTMKNYGGKFNFSLVNIDDESYGTSNNVLPQCR